MALNLNVVNFYKQKSIKLSDSFAVYIQTDPQKSFVECIECVGFTIPKLEQEEDVMTYGNVSQTFLIPKYDSCKEVNLTFNESTDNKIRNFIEEFSSYRLQQTFGTMGLATNVGSYITQKIPGLKIKIADNFLHRFVYEYSFKNLQIVNYTLYNLSYQNDSPCQISITFSFEDYAKGTISEIIKPAEKSSSTPAKECVNSEPALPADVTSELKTAEMGMEMFEEDLELVRTPESNMVESFYEPGKMVTLEEALAEEEKYSTDLAKQKGYDAMQQDNVQSRRASKDPTYQKIFDR